MDGAEEELRQKLIMLEKQVFDPALEGRGEEIWARMVRVRDRGRSLQYEMEKRGLGGLNGKEQSLDEETLEKARKVRIVSCISWTISTKNICRSSQTITNSSST